MNTQAISEARKAWFAADDAFSAVLQRVFKKRAGDMRYRPALWPPQVERSWSDVREAEERYYAAQRAAGFDI